MVSVKNFWSDYKGSKVTAAQQALLADLSNVLDTLSDDTVEAFKSTMNQLAKEAAGRHYFGEKNAVNGSNDDLTAAWLVAFEQFARQFPAEAGHFALQTANAVSGKCELGQKAREAAFDKAQPWVRENPDEALAAYRGAVMSALRNGEEADKVPARAFQVSSYFDVDSVQDYSRSLQALRMLYMVAEKGAAPEDEEAQRDLNRFAEKLVSLLPAIENSEMPSKEKEISQVVDLVKKRVSQNSTVKQETKAVFAQYAARYSYFYSPEEYRNLRDMIGALVHKKDFVHVAAPLVERGLCRAYKIPAYGRDFVMADILPFTQTDSKTQAQVAALLFDDIKQEAKTAPETATKLYFDVARICGAKSKVAEQADNEAFKLTPVLFKSKPEKAVTVLNKIARQQPVFSPLQEASLKRAENYLMRWAKQEPQDALKSYLGFISLNKDIGQSRHLALKPFLAAKSVFADDSFVQSAQDAVALMQTKNERGAATAITQIARASESGVLHKAVSIAEQNGGLQDLENRMAIAAYRNYAKLVRKTVKQDEQAGHFVNAACFVTFPFVIKALAARDFFETVKAKAATDRNKAVAMLHDCVQFCHGGGNRHSILCSDSRKMMAEQMMLLATEDPRATQRHMDKIKYAEAFSAIKDQKMFWNVQDKIYNTQAADRLSDKLSLSQRKLRDANLKTGKLNRLYNKHSFYGWASRALDNYHKEISTGAALLAGVLTYRYTAQPWFMPVFAAAGGYLAAAFGNVVVSSGMRHSTKALESKFSENRTSNGQAKHQKLTPFEFKQKHGLNG